MKAQAVVMFIQNCHIFRSPYLKKAIVGQSEKVTVDAQFLYWCDTTPYL